MANYEYKTPLDIKNRALQHVGATRIASETEDSKNAAAVNFAYDKVRKAELRRNNWRFALRRAVLRPVDTTTLLFQPALWSATVAYQPGAIVADSQGGYWISGKAFNFNVQPGTDDSWSVYFGPLSADAYSASTGYFTGELVYENLAPGYIIAFSALTDTTDDTATDPLTATAWSATTTFAKGQSVSYGGYYYLSLIDLNLNNTPGTYEEYDGATTYALNDLVAAVDGFVYISLVNSNTGNEPTTDSGANWLKNGLYNPWAASFAGSTAGNGWVTQNATLYAPNIIYPIQTGPASNTATRNVFRLPNNFLRRAPQDPNAGHNARLGGPSGNSAEDWVLEGDYLISSDDDVIALRFCADIEQVSAMDGMFCEGVAARLGLEICEELTQSADKLKTIAAFYNQLMSDARTVNGIETGPVEPAEDEWISVRK